MRPLPEQLERVPDEGWILRFVHPTHFDPDFQVLDAALTTKDYTPIEGVTYGASVYVDARTTIEAIEAVMTRWRQHGVARVQASALRACEVDVALSPQDCPHESLRDAHASLLHVTRQRRAAVVALLSKHIVRRPG